MLLMNIFRTIVVSRSRRNEEHNVLQDYKIWTGLNLLPLDVPYVLVLGLFHQL